MPCSLLSHQFSVFHDQRGVSLTKDAKRDIFIPRKAVDEEHGDYVHPQRERQPGGRVKELLDGAVAEVLVQGRAVVVDDEHAGALDDARDADGEEGAFAVRWLFQNVPPGVSQSAVDGDLLLDLIELCASSVVVRVVGVGVQFEENGFGLRVAALEGEPARRLGEEREAD